MNRRDWNGIATTLGELHARLVERGHLKQAIGVELAVRSLCSLLRERSSRFDSRRFMRVFSAAK